MTTHGAFAYLNGSVLPAHEAAISPFDVGLLRGYAVFDLLQTIGSRPFMLDEHLQRLRSSADLIGLRVPLSDDEIAGVIDELLKRNGHTEATVRLVLTGGYSPDGMHYDPSTPTFLIVTHEMFSVPAHFYEQGAKLLSVEHRREVPEAKTTNYLTWLRNHPRIEAEGALDLLYHDGEIISEAATASFYVVRDGVILAPDSGVLWGTVGDYVLELARGTHRVEFRQVTLAETLAADECFLTSSVRGVGPITRIDDHLIGDGAPGPVTRDLMERFDASAYSER